MTKIHPITWFSTLFMVIAYMLPSCQCANSSYGRCREAERNVLLTLKQSFNDPSDKLSSWHGVNCCAWDGVGCDSKTGYVVKINLRNNFVQIFTKLSNQLVYNTPSALETSKLDSSLLQLRYLNYLDLSGNNFSGSLIPDFLGEMNGLEYLNLSLASFNTSSFPSHLGNLTKLQVLDVSNYRYESDEISNHFTQSFEWLSTLSSLKVLYMKGVNLSRVRNLFPMLSKLPFLSVLSLSSCELDDAQLSPKTHLPNLQELHLKRNSLFSFPLLLKNMSSLRVLDLSRNNFNCSVPAWLSDLKELEYLDLSYNEFNKVEGGLGRILWGLCHLKTFDFSNNIFKQESLESNKNTSLGCIKNELEVLNGASSGLTGVLPDELCQLKELKMLDLSYNTLHGSIHALIGNLTGLIEINLRSNQLNGTIPASLGNLLNLSNLNLQYNSLYGAIPTTIGNLSSLTGLGLSSNHLTGIVPDSIGQLANLEFFFISSNHLVGNISETHFLNVTKLTELSLSSNQLTIAFKSDWLPPFQLERMYMRSCKLGTAFPRWIGTQKNLGNLALHNASITGPWPKWFQSSSLRSLDLSYNEISGHIPHNLADLFPQLNSLDFSSNRINGTIPRSFCKMRLLMYVSISKNMLSGEIPNCENTPFMQTLKLSFNKLTGVIPNNIGNLSQLRWLQLNNNNLKGEIPSSLSDCNYLLFVNLANNEFSGNISTWIGETEDLSQAQIIVLRNNSFEGYIPKQLCQMESLQILDVAYNNFTGSIPSCLGNLTAMTTIQHLASGVLGYQQDSEGGNELTIKRLTLEYKSSIRLLVNLDMSSNNLVGIIPPELTLLFGLLGLNLSNNHLTGPIPKNIGNLTALESFDLSNNQLSGMIPTGLSLLHSLSSLNLSNNNFSGQIPTGNQLQALPDPSIYAGNPNLCGFPLPECYEPVHVPGTTNEEVGDDEEDKSDKIWLYLAISIGYAFGLWAFFGVLVLKKKWRYAYFRYADNATDWIYVFIVVNARRLRRKLMGDEE